MERDTRTPDTVDLDTFLSLPKAEALERFGLTDEEYERVCRDVEPVAALRANREAQIGYPIPAVIHLGSRGGLRYDRTRSGLVTISRDPKVIRL